MESLVGSESEERKKRDISSCIVGAGMEVPARVITNQHFASYLETSDEWIQDRTGIKERRWVDGEVSASELAEPAARRALAAAGITTEQVDAVIVATVTPDYLFPSTACCLQRRLGIKNGLAFDVNAVCSGFIYALTTADSLIASGHCRNALVVGVDIYSSIIDPKDRTTCVLFGDGAGAVVVSAASPEESQERQRGIYASELHADGNWVDLLYTPAGTASRVTPESLQQGAHFLRMQGREVFKLAVRRLGDVSLSVLQRSGVKLEDVDWFVSHQANKRILSAMARHLGVDQNKVLINVDKYGNTSAASLPILLAEYEQLGTIKKGDLVLLSAFGGGITWGAILVRW